MKRLSYQVCPLTGTKGTPPDGLWYRMFIICERMGPGKWLSCQRLFPHNPDNLSLIPVAHGGRRSTSPGNCYLLTQVVSCLSPMVTTERAVKGNGTNQKCIARHTHMREPWEERGGRLLQDSRQQSVGQEITSTERQQLNRSQKNQKQKTNDQGEKASCLCCAGDAVETWAGPGAVVNQINH